MRYSKIIAHFICLVLFVFPGVLHAAEKPEIFVQLGHTLAVDSVAFSPDGRYALSGSTDKTMKLWEVSSGREIRTFQGHTSYVTSVAFSPDGRYALSGSGDGTMKLWEVSSGREMRTFQCDTRGVYSVAFSPDGRYALAGGSYDGMIKLWEVSHLYWHRGIRTKLAPWPSARMAGMRFPGVMTKQ